MERQRRPPAEILEDGNSYIYTPDGAALEQINPAGNITWYHHDQLGSTRLLTDRTGTVTGSSSYTAYGAPVATTGASRPAFGFAGGYTDSETGLLYLRARYYDPATGQFISRDPLAPATRSAYAYATG